MTLNQRMASLFVRYWSANMNLAWGTAENWPGFNDYTQEERAEMKRIAGGVPSGEFTFFMVTMTLLFLTIAAVMTGLNFYVLDKMVGGDTANTPASIFFGMLGLNCVVCLIFVFPISMAITSLLTGWKYSIPATALPPLERTAYYFSKSVWQIVRIFLIMIPICMAYWLFVPRGSKLDIAVQWLALYLAPVVQGMMLALYAGTMLKRSISSGPATESSLPR